VLAGDARGELLELAHPGVYAAADELTVGGELELAAEPSQAERAD